MHGLQLPTARETPSPLTSLLDATTLNPEIDRTTQALHYNSSRASNQTSKQPKATSNAHRTEVTASEKPSRTESASHAGTRAENTLPIYHVNELDLCVLVDELCFRESVGGKQGEPVRGGEWLSTSMVFVASLLLLLLLEENVGRGGNGWFRGDEEEEELLALG